MRALTSFWIPKSIEQAYFLWKNTEYNDAAKAYYCERLDEMIAYECYQNPTIEKLNGLLGYCIPGSVAKEIVIYELYKISEKMKEEEECQSV